MTSLVSGLGRRWQQLAPREKSTLRLGAGVVVVLALWTLLLAPAWHTLQRAQGQHRVLDAELQTMQRLRDAALALQDEPLRSRDAMVQALQRTLQPLGTSAQLQVSGTQATLTLRQIPAGLLADWLIQSRAQARMQPDEIRLARATSAAAAVWSGTLVYTLPPA